MEFTFSVSSNANLSFMGNTPGVVSAKPDSLHGHSRRCYPPICPASKTRYNPSIASKKGVIGFDSLNRYRGMKPQRHHSLAAFSFSAPFMAAQVGDSQESAGFAPRFASLSTRLSRRHCLTASATVVSTNQQERIMPKSPSKRAAVRVAVISGQPIVNSRNIANVFGKHHGNLVQRIKQLECSPEFRCSNFSEHPYINEQNGQTYTEYNITRDGFAFLCMGFTGAKAAQWKEKYINTFNRMAERLAAKALPAPQATVISSSVPDVSPPSLMNRRWLVSYDHTGKEQVTAVPPDAAIISPTNADDVAAFLLEMVPQRLMAEALATLTGRIARVLNQNVAQRKVAALQ